MRVKSETRRQAIVASAAEAFRERGFEGASMADVACRVGGSKATLYSYFASKEELFAAVMMQAAKEQAGPIFESLSTAPELEPALARFAREYLAFALRPEILAISRVCVANGERTGVGKLFYDKGVKVAWAIVAERFERAMGDGVLRRADPWQAAIHFKGLVEAGLVDRRLRGCGVEIGDAEVEAGAAAAVDVFLRAYRA